MAIKTLCIKDVELVSIKTHAAAGFNPDGALKRRRSGLILKANTDNPVNDAAALSDVSESHGKTHDGRAHGGHAAQVDGTLYVSKKAPTPDAKKHGDDSDPDRNNLMKSAVSDFLKEIRTMSTLRHPNIVMFIAASVRGGCARGVRLCCADFLRCSWRSAHGPCRCSVVRTW